MGEEGRAGGASVALVSVSRELVTFCAARLIEVALAGAVATISSDALMNPFDGELRGSRLNSPI